MKYLGIFLLCLSCAAFAEEHAEVTVKSLAWPAFNFFVLVSVLVITARKPISKIFTEKSRKIQELFRLAENKYKEAKHRHDEVTEKLKNVDHEAEKIIHEAHVEAEHLEQRFHEELRERTDRMWSDSHYLIEAERRQLETELNQEVIEVVVKEAKEKIGANNDYKKKASNKLLESVK